MPGKGTILSFKQALMGGLFFCISSVSFQALFISRHRLIITLFQEDNIFGTNASLTYGPQIATVSKNFNINLEGQNYVHFYVILSRNVKIFGIMASL